jgi:hypothetical protein
VSRKQVDSKELVYNTQNHWDPGFCPSSNILKSRNLKTEIDPVSNSCVFEILKCQMMDELHKASDSVWK